MRRLGVWGVASGGLSDGCGIGTGKGCVVGPVAAGGVDPVDCGFGGDAEHLGENDGWDFGGELGLCCSSGGSGVDAVGGESLAEPESGDRSPGEVAWEQ